MKDDVSKEVATASQADIAADMSYHRRTYHRFVRILIAVVAGTAVVLLGLFFIFY